MGRYTLFLMGVDLSVDHLNVLCIKIRQLGVIYDDLHPSALNSVYWVL